MELIKQIIELAESVELSEGKLSAKWHNYGEVYQLSTAQRNTLEKNAKAAGDDEVLDVINQVKADIEAKKKGQRAEDKPKKMSKTEEGALLNKIWSVIEESVGNAVPDGDPMDSIFPKLKKLLKDAGVEFNDWDSVQWLDKATKHVNGKAYKGYNDYCAEMWDSYNEVAADGEKRQNPWR